MGDLLEFSNYSDKKQEDNFLLMLSTKNMTKFNFPCTFDGCSASFDRQWKLEGHICGHTNERPFKCSIENCSKAYRTNSHLQRHVKTCHKQEEELSKEYLACTFPNCSKLVTSKRNLKRHLQSHKTQEAFKCEPCNLKFYKQNSFKAHKLAHEGILPHKCSECGNKFCTSKELMKHMRCHKIYKCEYESCQLIFSDWSMLRKHFKEKHPTIYHCNNCSRSFHNKKILEEHVISHTSWSDREVIVCPFENCKRSYFHKRNLNHHIKNFHESKKFQCSFQVCRKLLSSKAKLAAHEKQHDPNYQRQPSIKKSPRPRCDKGLPSKSLASILSGINVPTYIDKLIARNELSIHIDEKTKK